MAIVTEKLQKHEESRPGFLSRELKTRLELVKASASKSSIRILSEGL